MNESTVNREDILLDILGKTRVDLDRKTNENKESERKVQQAAQSVQRNTLWLQAQRDLLDQIEAKLVERLNPSPSTQGTDVPA